MGRLTEIQTVLQTVIEQVKTTVDWTARLTVFSKAVKWE
jgi:hypothetical protein